MEIRGLDTFRHEDEGPESCSATSNVSLDTNVSLDKEITEEFFKALKEFEAELIMQEDVFDPVVPTAVAQSSTINSISAPYAMISPSLEVTTGPQRLNRHTSERKSKSGLRNFSRKIMEKVKETKVTSFEKIADEMFREMAKDNEVSTEYKKKNVRRRVYDVLNVLVAMEMVLKNKREITWVGTPSDITEQKMLQQYKTEIEESIQQKTADLQHVILEMIAYKNLVKTKQNARSHQTFQQEQDTSPLIHLPFIAVRTSKNTVITHATSNDNLEHVLNFDQPFEIHDNIKVLIRMGMAFGLERNMCSQENLEISKTMVSKDLEPYLVELAKSGPLKPSCIE